jgi:hypothetical protein
MEVAYKPRIYFLNLRIKYPREAGKKWTLYDSISGFLVRHQIFLRSRSKFLRGISQ